MHSKTNTTKSIQKSPYHHDKAIHVQFKQQIN